MAYKTERKLQEDIMALEKFFSASDGVTYIRREVPVGECIPDMVLVQFSKMPKPSKLPKRWNGIYSHIIWLLRKWKSLRRDEVAKLCYANLERIDPVLRDLISSNFVKEEAEKLVLSDELALLKADVIAVEAKLYKWREALMQATRYNEFADRAIVAMDASRIPRRPEILEEFRTLQVGLCAVSPDQIEWLVLPPESRQISSHEREYIINSTIIPSRQALWVKR